MHQHLPRQHLRVTVDLLHVVDRPGNYSRTVQQFQPVLRVLGGEGLLKQGCQFLLSRLPVPRVAESVVIHQVLSPDGPAKLLPGRLGCCSQVQVAVPGPQRLVWRRNPVRRTQRPGNLPLGEVDRRLPDGVRHPRLHQRSVHHLPLSGLQRVNVGRHDPVGPEQSCREVGNGHTDLGRRRVGMPGNAHQPADSLRHQVEPAPVPGRSRAAEARNGAVNEGRLDLLQLVVRQAQALHDAGPEIFDDHVGAFKQPLEDLSSPIALEVQCQASLVAVYGKKPRRPVLDERWPHPPVVVAAIGLLHLDHVRTHVGQHHGAHRPRKNLGEVQDYDTGQRPGGNGSGHIF